MAKDRFAEIAASYEVDEDRGLICPRIPEPDGRKIPLSEGGDAFCCPEKITTEEQLAKALSEQREYYRPFLADYAPKAEEFITRTELKEFSYSLDGGEEQAVTLPHYGGPDGKHTAIYRGTFSAEVLPEGKRAWLSFLGVDYIAEVMVNGRFAGRHEGFFSPFAFDVTEFVTEGENTLEIVVRNDAAMSGHHSANSNDAYGDKVYAATGLGWDGPEDGWHHCPAGMGIYNKVFYEVRPTAFISDLFVRVQGNEIWVDCHSGLRDNHEVSFLLSVYGKNHYETVVEKFAFSPTTTVAAGIGDTLTRADLMASGKLGRGTPLRLQPGEQTFVIPFDLSGLKTWTPDEPWLYRAIVSMEVDGQIVSARSCQFGMRTFTQDLESEPKGKFYLNGEEISLRGANTMGYEQQDVLHEDWDQLIDDILLGKLCNMNFLRITQRPVQEEIYHYCDCLGMMVQTDLPLFGTLKINQYCETLRQVGEMERLVRSHPCCILDSYINEPFPNAKEMPHCMVSRAQLMNFFDAADDIVRMYHPDRVTKHVDGDYDPPNNKLPDNHCYTMWYNGHGIDFGKMHKGEWLFVKPGWHFGCGEFGAEGLDPVDLMQRRYPKEWIREPFDPKNILFAQTPSFHYFFYETPHSIGEWVEESQRHQAFATKMMTSAMRRNPNMNTFAIHLFIDAFPSGWMKSIMDCERRPKKAYYEYRECLAPVFCNLRSDRFTFFGGENMTLESYLCCDAARPSKLRFFAEADGSVIASGEADSRDGYFQGNLCFALPQVEKRTALRVVMAAEENGEIVNWTEETYTVFPSAEAVAPKLLEYEEYDAARDAWDERIKNGETVTFAPLSQGTYEICGKTVKAKNCGMMPLYTVSRDTGHPLVEGFLPNDFGWWYDSSADRITPILYATVEADGVLPILTSGNQDDNGAWNKTNVCAEWDCGKGKVRLCQLALEHREKDPIAVEFCRRLNS